jgi:hypothetical protein
MKKVLILMAIFLFLLLTSVLSFADPIFNIANDSIEDKVNGAIYATYQNSGDFLGIVVGNNDGNGGLALTEDSIEDFLDLNDEDFVLVQTPSISYTGAGLSSGTWETVAPVNSISFYVVKAANAFAIYQVDPPDGAGSWSTYDLWKAGYGGNGALQISHFNGYNPGAPVPEPATMLLLGSGLVGLAGFGRKKFKK